MVYDIIFILGEQFVDHPLCGGAILKRLLEKHGYSVGIIECPQQSSDVLQLGIPRLFFGVSSGSIDSMVRNYTPLKKLRKEDEHLNYHESVPDRAVLVFCNWLKEKAKGSLIVLGGTEASLRRFVHYDYWDNALRQPILVDSRADILAYGNAEKQVLEIAERLRLKKDLVGISGTCILSKELLSGFLELPSSEEVISSKEKFCVMQTLFTNEKDLAQKVGTRYVLQFKSPVYTSVDLDSYYELPFTRDVSPSLRGFQFSVVTHRGCIGDCSFCSLKLLQGDKIVSRSEESILREVTRMTSLPHFRGNVDDLGGPSANMYGMDCHVCSRCCLDCKKLDRTNHRLIALLQKVRAVPGVKHVFIRSGIRYDLASSAYLREIVCHHIYDTLRIAPEHVVPSVLRLMNKDRGDLQRFIFEFDSLHSGKSLSFYFMTAHPGSGMVEAQKLATFVRGLKNAEKVQVFTPTPMTDSTCMYYTGMHPFTLEKVFVPYAYAEKKAQKRVIFG